MQRTAEARWFLPGRATREQVAWFTAGTRVRREGKRTDRYLDLAGCLTVGIKQREGQLELKALTAPPRAFRLAGIAGRKDQWAKSSLAMGGKARGRARLAGRWLPVRKARMVLSEPGCNVELARIEAFGRRFFSLGFEAASAGILERTLARFFAARGPLPAARLAARRSLSYPAWLASVAPASGPRGKTPSRARRGPRSR